MTKLSGAAALVAFILCAGGAWAAGGACPSGVPSGITTCYFASTARGSDANSGTSESSPWAHIPGMPDCSANCAAHTPTAGNGFILRGGDSWLAGDLGVNWTWGGTSSNRIYIGVDPAWYDSSVCRASWCRPIFDCQTSMCSSGGPMFEFGGASVQYVTLDNIEFTGYREGASGNVHPMMSIYGPHVEVENSYLHGWSHVSSGYTVESYVVTTNISNGPSHVTGDTFHDNVIDGADTSRDMMRGILHGWDVYDNVVRYTVAEIDGAFNSVHGNLVTHSVLSATGLHCDNILQYGPTSGNDSYIYNNVVLNDSSSDCPGGVLWVNGLDGNSSAVTYVFNNVMYYTGGEGLSIGGHASFGNTGVYYVYNNTLDTSGRGIGCLGNGESGSSSTTYFSNNHCIAAAGGVICNGTGTTCVDQGGNLAQTEAQANADGYTSTQTFIYSATSSTDPTVGKGVNWASICSGPLLPMCSDTSYPTYDTTNHTVVMRKVNNRPPRNGGKWDIGAYEFSSSSATGGSAGTTGSGGTATGGSAGTGGTAGIATGGTAGTGGTGGISTGGSAGSSFGGTSGATSGAGAESGAAPSTSSNNGGCGCHVPRRKQGGLAGLLFSLAGLGLLIERRRRARG